MYNITTNSIMSQIPEELLQQIMQMTGMNRKDAESELLKSIQEMSKNIGSKSVPGVKKRSAHSKYDRGSYPWFLPSSNIRKYTIRIALKGMTPVIWRKFECPSNISLRHLTELAISLMGWENEHLNQIQEGRHNCYQPYYQRDDESIGWYDIFNQEEFMLSDILFQKGKTVCWEYDFGDSWEHDIRLSSIDDYKPGESHAIVFRGGRRACPPEDCGGVWGYQDLLDTLKKFKSGKRLNPEEREHMDWAGWDKEYDPEFLDESMCQDICNRFSKGADRRKKNNASLKPAPDTPVTSALYDEVMSLAFRIRRNEPWIFLNDSQIYVVRMQDGSDVYIATMGYGGESFDIQVYDGPESFATYVAMCMADFLPHFELQEAISWADYKCIMYLEPLDDIMTDAQCNFIKQWAKSHGFRIERRHGYPLVQHYRPHRYQSMMMNEEQELLRFKEALEAVEWFSRKIFDSKYIKNLGFTEYREYATAEGGKVVPLVVRTAEGYSVDSTTLPAISPKFETVVLSDSELKPLRSIQKKGTYYCRLLHAPGFIGNGDDRENAYSALMFIFIDKNTGMVSITQLTEQSDSFEHDAIMQLRKKIIREDIAPQRLITDDARTEACLKDFCRQLGITLEYRHKRIPELTAYCNDFLNSF